TEVLPWPRGVLKLPPNTGKTLIATCVTDFLHKPTLYVIERQLLMYQSAEAFQKSTTMSVGFLGDGHEDWNSDITFAMAQTVRAALDGEKTYLGKIPQEKRATSEVRFKVQQLKSRQRRMEVFLT